MKKYLHDIGAGKGFFKKETKENINHIRISCKFNQKPNPKEVSPEATLHRNHVKEHSWQHYSHLQNPGDNPPVLW